MTVATLSNGKIGAVGEQMRQTQAWKKGLRAADVCVRWCLRKTRNKLNGVLTYPFSWLTWLVAGKRFGVKDGNRCFLIFYPQSFTSPKLLPRPYFSGVRVLPTASKHRRDGITAEMSFEGISLRLSHLLRCQNEGP